jgi:hypothetical protein
MHIIQDLSFGDSKHPAVNANIDPDDFLCELGTFAKIWMLVAQAPSGTQGVSLGVDAAFRRRPVHPDQQHHFIVQWDGACYINHCAAFGGKSACSIFGCTAAAFVAICHKHSLGPCKKWVNGFVFLRQTCPNGSLCCRE